MPVALDGAADRRGRARRSPDADARGKHGVGRVDHVEDRLVGIKSREIYEAPAAVILHTAHRALEGLTLSKEQLRFNRFVADELSQATYDGLWFTALHRDLRDYVTSSQRVVNGEVRLLLDHGSAVVVGRRSAGLALRPLPGHLRHGGLLRPPGGRRLHQALGPPAGDRGGPPGQRLVVDRAARRSPAVGGDRSGRRRGTVS